MNHVRVTTINGHEVEIPHEEAMRISKGMDLPLDSFHEKVKAHNKKYLEKAEKNINDIGSRYGFHNIETEEDLKEFLSCMCGISYDAADALIEIVEQRIANHHHRIYTV
jgi:hypothetical protein